jgi:hypothetical protein
MHQPRATEVRGRLAFAAIWLVGISSPSMAQIPSPGAPGPYAVDLRVSTSAIPSDAAFLPPVPSGTRVPTRGAGGEAGVHVYLFRLGPSRIGLGVAALRVRGGASPGATSSTSGGTVAAQTPDVDAALTVVAPQLSFNFGTSDGWSYLSAGVGRARATAVTSPVQAVPGGSAGTPGASANSGWISSTNVGGGARWFLRRHLAVTFDVRVHVIGRGASRADRPSTPRTTVTAASVGISVR